MSMGVSLLRETQLRIVKATRPTNEKILPLYVSFRDVGIINHFYCVNLLQFTLSNPDINKVQNSKKEKCE